MSDPHWLVLGAMPDAGTREAYIIYLAERLGADLAEYAGASFTFRNELIQVGRVSPDVRH